MPRIQVDSLTVDYEEAGSGLPIVFIPGITEYKEAFAFQFRGLSDNYRVISYDVRRGLKRSADYTLDLLVGDLNKLLKALRLRSAVICGHSFGGLIAMQFAMQNPDKTNALILTSAFAAPPEVSQDRLFSWTSSAGHPFYRSLGTSLRIQMSRLLGRRTLSAVAKEDEVAAVRTIARQAVKSSNATITQRLRIIQRADFQESMANIQAPTLVVVGANDRSFFLSSAQQLYEGIPDSSLEVIEGGGHFCFLTRHDLFNTAVDEFLSAHMMGIS